MVEKKTKEVSSLPLIFIIIKGVLIWLQVQMRMSRNVKLSKGNWNASRTEQQKCFRENTFFCWIIFRSSNKDLFVFETQIVLFKALFFTKHATDSWLSRIFSEKALLSCGNRVILHCFNYVTLNYTLESLHEQKWVGCI